MRKILLVAFAFLFLKPGLAQVSESDAAIAVQLVKKNSTSIGLSAGDLNNFIISDTYLSAEGIRYVYLQQSYQGIPVYNQLQVLAFRNDNLVSNKGSRIRSIEKIMGNKTSKPVLAAKNAVAAALTESKLSTIQEIEIVRQTARKLEFGQLGVSHENITAELIWYPVSEKVIKLAWQVFVTPVNANDMWLMKVDADSGSILGKDNLTVYDTWQRDDPVSTGYPAQKIKNNDLSFQPKAPVLNNPYKMPVVNSATYRVVPYPAESPSHPGGTPALVTDPWLLAGGNATSLKWHNDGTSDHDSTRGNNVWAAEDRSNTNSVIDKAAISTSPQPNLSFDFNPDFTQTPDVTTPPNQQFNITNLFYWNNIIHDIMYQYGFDEVAGNFQKDNLGRGGVGNDYVIADAQDGGGTSNANFSTPSDGARPRMQMYIWTAPTPDRDGDVDNGIVVHEFGHGISSRLTGGPSQSGCVSNDENGGEGWSDYYGLMLTTNWATAAPSDGFTIPRAIGTYVRGQSPAGSGIRNFRYCTNMAVNPLVYSSSLPSESHNRGEYWCMVLWEMTWEMIQQTGINPNLFNASGAGGNSAALKLVTEGMKLQPCGPGFIDARNAILQADTLFFGGQYSCSIWKAFAKRGMGRNASQGSASSVTDQVPDFSVDNGFFNITQNITEAGEGQNVTYTNHITAGNCTPISNFFATDTLPANVTYVSGGSYNATNRTITFGPINLSNNQSQNFPFTVTVNNGTYFTPVTHFNESVSGAGIPADWTASPASGNTWTVSAAQSNSAPNSFFAPDMPVLTDMVLSNTNSYTLIANISSYTTLSFWHRFNTEDGWDGGVVEISTNGGVNWSDLGSKMITGKYNGSLGTGSNNSIGGRSAFTGNNGASFMHTVINLSSYAGQSVRIRFRFASDDNTAPVGGGWYVDDIILYTQPAISIKSNLYNTGSQLLSVTDTITLLLPPVPACIPVTITTQPSNLNGCEGGNGTISIVVNGTSPVYQWQVNAGAGFIDLTDSPVYSGVSSATLTITGLSVSMSNYLYRCVLSNSCTNSFNSGSASLSVGTVATFTSQPVNSTVCEGVATSFSVTANGATSYQWQVNTGSGFTDLSNAAPYSGIHTATVTITNPAAELNGNQYRCVLGSCAASINSTAATLTISVPVSITAQPVDATVCEGTNTGFTISTTGSVSSYQWQISTDGGLTYSAISGTGNPSYNLSSVVPGQTGNRFRCIVTGACGPITSVAALLTVNPLPAFTVDGLNLSALCVSDPPITLQASLNGGTWTGNGVQGNTFNPGVAGTGNNSVVYSVTSLGCTTVRSTVVEVNECAERHIRLSEKSSVTVYPNPNNGTFRVKVNTDLYRKLGIKVYNSQGQLLKSLIIAGVFYNSELPVDITGLPDGTYHLYLYNDENGYIHKGFSFVIHK